MGMFDTLRSHCPQCGKLLEFQSKIGACELKEYSLHSAPLLIIADFNNRGVTDRLDCEHCGVKLALDVTFSCKLRAKDSVDSDAETRTV